MAQDNWVISANVVGETRVGRHFYPFKNQTLVKLVF